MSPILFNIVVDMLAILIGRAKDNGQVGGLVPHLVDGGVSECQGMRRANFPTRTQTIAYKTPVRLWLSQSRTTRSYEN